MEELLLQIKELKKVLILQKEILTIEELSLYTGYTVDYIYKLVHQGSIPYTKPPLGRKLFFVKEEIVNWLTYHKHYSSQEIDAMANSYIMTKKLGYEK